ncbi:MAG: GEVED domain-containing protein [Chitinophagaceae bacterium]
MKKAITTLTILLAIAGNLLAQYSIDWVRPADNIQKTGVMITRDNSDNAIVTGYITSNNIYTRKYDKFGVLQWEKISTSGIAGNYERPVWVNTDNSNNVFVAGYRYSGTSQIYPNALVVLKYNAAGTLLWKNNITISALKPINLRGEVDNYGNLYIGAAGSSSPSGFLLYKFSSSGTLIFSKTSTANAPNGFGSMRLKGNKIVMTGSSGNRSAAPVIAWDLSGNILWTASFLGRGGVDAEIDGSGNVYMLTSYSNQVSISSGEDISVYKLNKRGKQVWKKSYHFGGTDNPTRFTLVADKLSVIGYSSINASYFDWITFQTDIDGTMLWNTRYNETTTNDEIPAFIAAKANGEVFVTGKGGPVVMSPTGSSFLRLITLKYDKAGTRKWVDSVNINGGFGIACTLASDSSLFVLSHANMTAYHLLDQINTGICSIPTGLTVANITATSADFSWSAVSGALLYHLRYKPTLATTWTVVSTNNPAVTVTNLTAGTAYEYAVEAVCNSGPSGYSTTQTFSTSGTGYCTTGGQSQALEYLNFVWIGGIMNSTGIDNGYGDYTNLSTTFTQGQLVNGYLSGRVPYPEFENYYIWIDFNHDNDFTDPGEQVVSLYSDFTGWIAVNFTVPANAPLGQTRMRITQSSGAAPSPCGVYARGETEDYTVIINPPGGKPIVLKSDITSNQTKLNYTLYPNPVSDKLTIEKNKASGIVKVEVINAAGLVNYIQYVNPLLTVLTLPMQQYPSGLYFIRITSNDNIITIKKVLKN